MSFQYALDSHEIGLREALDFAFEKDVYGVEIVRNAEQRCERRVCEFKPFQRHFNSDLEPVFEEDDLRDVPHLAPARQVSPANSDGQGG
jgi:hypothetical protein